MSSTPIFYTQVNNSVQKVLNLRKKYYKAEFRDSNAHEWLFKKMAWATARASNSARGEARLEIPVQGGLGVKGGGMGVPPGLYNRQGGGTTLKYFPKPHIESVNISAEGDFGSIVKAELKFQVHRLADLKKMQPFFDIGGDVVISWGWNRAGEAGGRDGYFQGKIYNFSYNVNTAGGFDCTTYAMMPGITIIGGNPDAPTNDDIFGLQDGAGNILRANSLINRYRYEEQVLSTNLVIPKEPGAVLYIPGAYGASSTVTGGTQLVYYAKDWGEAKDRTGIKELTSAEKKKAAAKLTGNNQNQNQKIYNLSTLNPPTLVDSGITFNSTTSSTFLGYLPNSLISEVYEVTANANRGQFKVVRNSTDGTYRFIRPVEETQTRYQSRTDAVAARNASIAAANAARRAGQTVPIDPEELLLRNLTAQNTSPAGGPQPEPELHLYISLERLVMDINKLASDNSSWFTKNGIKIICNGDVTKGLVPSDVTKLVSANPTELLFPGFAKYGPINEFTFGTAYEDAMRAGDLSKCMISFRWLRNEIVKIGTDKTKNTKSADNTVAGLLQKVFDLIYKHSGERFKLAMVSNPKSVKGSEILIVDVNYIDTNNVTAYPITAVDNGSIARNISLQSKVPNEFQTVAFVAASNGFTGQNAGSIGGVIGRIGGQEQNPTTPNPQNLEQAKQQMDSTGVSPENVKSLQAALKRERISYGASDSGVGKEVIPFPLDFTVTLDGIDGFIFGNTITCNYLPEVYKQSETLLAFTVTKVNHTIANNDWTTTLNTVCRIVS